MSGTTCSPPSRLAPSPSQPRRHGAMTRNRAGPGNVPMPLNATYYAQRASAGLIVSEATQVSPQGVVIRAHLASTAMSSRRLEACDRCVHKGRRADLLAALACRADFASVVAARRGAPRRTVSDCAAGRR